MPGVPELAFILALTALTYVAWLIARGLWWVAERIAQWVGF